MADDFDEKPRKKSKFGTYVIIIAVVALIIGVAVMYMGNKGKSVTPTNTTNPTAPITILQLQGSLTSLSTTLDGISGRLATVETKIGGLTAPDVTRADITALQASIHSLAENFTAFEGNASTRNMTGSIDYWLTKDSDDNIYLHTLSAENITLVAEITVFYDTPVQLDNATHGTYDDALLTFYDKVGTERDYIPNLIPTGTPGWNFTYINTTYTSLNYTVGADGPYWVNLTPDSVITTSIITNITTKLTWEYSSIAFHTASFSIDANEETSNQINYLPADYDTISVRLLPSLEVSGTGGGGGI